MDSIEIIELYHALVEDYRTWKHEAIACGTPPSEIPSFEDWATGRNSAREAAEARWRFHEENDTLDLY